MDLGLTNSASLDGVFARSFSDRLERTYSYIEELASHFCFHVIHELRLFQEGSAFREINVAPEAQYLLAAVLDILREEGFLAFDGDLWRMIRPCPLDDSARLQQEARDLFPTAAPILEMLERCRKGSVDFLMGRQSGLSVVFPRGDTRLWEQLHRHDSVMSIYADPIPAALAGVLRRAGKGARVLEVGAGVGAVLHRCLPLLGELDVGEYWVTDLAKVFVQRIEASYPDAGFLRGAVFDLDAPWAQQGLEPGSFDAIVGVNVLHSAKNLPFTLSQLRLGLTPNGCVILGEGSPPQRGKRWRLDLVFAFLRGWWDVSIDRLRPRPGFLFPREWIDIFQDSGYPSAIALPGEDWFRGDCRGGLVMAGNAVHEVCS